MAFFGFHPIIERWFQGRFAGPTEPQRLGWPPIAAGGHTLIAAPTGSGKTLTAFLSVIDRLLKQSLEDALEDEIRAVYVSPLRALSNDMHRNLEVPLQEILDLAASEGLTNAAGEPLAPIRAGLRTGDTSPSQRAALVRRPPHILVTTPESLYLMLTAEKSREKLRRVETIIVDEIHALVRDKRGSHLALTLERLEALCERPLQRIGLSATQKPIERMADFLVGDREEAVPQNRIATVANTDSSGSSSSVLGDTSRVWEVCGRACTIVDVGHGRELDLAIEVPPSELGAVCMHEQWAEVNTRLVELIQEHRSTLIFVNTRRMAERVTHQLSELLGEDAVGSHHGSLSADIRLKTEQRLKSGELKAVVATASLELGLDVGYIDLVVQLGTPRAISTFLQRIGRSGHSLGLVPKGRLFALTRDELAECMALIRAVRAGRLDAVPIPEAPLDVLAQQIVAEVSAQEWETDDLFALFRRAAPYRSLTREQFDETVEYLSEGISQSSGRSRVYLHHDRVGRRLRARKGARIAATSNAGAIPEIASYRVIAEPEQTVVGTLDEEFATESQAGSVFLLGNTSWRIQHVRGGDVTVADAGGAPPTVPFWQGEAPGRTFELSEEIAKLRGELEQRLRAHSGTTVPESPGPDADVLESLADEQGTQEAWPEIEAWLVQETRCCPHAARQMVLYAAAQLAAIGLLPTQRRIVFERFFDESGGMQMVVHAPFGSRINQAWGLAMRKRFCRSFDFELQATADDDGFILSLGPQHSFPLESMFGMLNSDNVQPLLEQAILAIPMFQIRWRWNVTRALLVLRRRNGKKVPPPLQRFRADDLLTAVFPTVTGCLENVVGDIELPDHPLTRQTMEDCLREALDVDGLRTVLSQVADGKIEFIARDTREPSPFCYELLNSNPYAFLDGGEVQERRARAVATRRSLTVESVRDLGRLDPEAIEQVRRDAQPLVRNADELHDALLSRIVLPTLEGGDWQDWYDELAEQRRATTLVAADGRTMWAAAERLPAACAVFPDAVLDPPIEIPDGVRRDWSSVEARVALVRGFIETSGPTTAREIAERMGITSAQADAALEALEGEGVVLRGRFTPTVGLESAADDLGDKEPAAAASSREVEWCHRRLLARIHRLTLEGLRKQIQPVSVGVFIRFLTRYHGLLPGHRRSGTNGLFEVVSMLQGIDVPAVCWERDVLPGRIDKYRPEWLDELCLTGEVGWGRLYCPKRDPDRSKPMASLTRVAPISIFLRTDVGWIVDALTETDVGPLSSPAEEVRELLESRGAMFATDLMTETRMLPSQLGEALGELVSRGLLTSDAFSGLRQLIAERADTAHRSRRRANGLVRQRNVSRTSGRWSIWRRPPRPDQTGSEAAADNEVVEQWAWQLLRRWGVVFRDLLTRETGAPRWFELLQVYRRLEARGEIRGGRFIAGVAGEQFALGETVRQLRTLRDDDPGSSSVSTADAAGKAASEQNPQSPPANEGRSSHRPAAELQELVFVSAADPLNLIGILTDHPRVPSTASNVIAYWNGVPAAALRAGEVQEFAELPEPVRTAIRERFGVAGIGPRNPSNNGAVPTPEGESAAPENGADSKRDRAKRPSYPNKIPRPLIS